MSEESLNKKPEKPKSKKWRQIVIETDGTEIRLVKTQVAGSIELASIFKLLFDQFKVRKIKEIEDNG